ncbi:hypothetical protein T4E_11326 [Trichinella pseudospiralis]|uniref:Uncharacterized protein n=1 Tax=Trichinella pseudospiralis TaxID=6337 RepID=A0A0V0XLI5_TRIPS|nr:hypothetical protein T4E_5482 [Trichinella pseudospiralis]KRX88973.1 hypothetical protein T4E_11326 [Trichinella pseudospiralis]
MKNTKSENADDTKQNADGTKQNKKRTRGICGSPWVPILFPNNFLFFYFIQFAFLHFHTSYFVNFFQQIFYYDSFILTLTLKKTDT